MPVMKVGPGRALIYGDTNPWWDPNAENLSVWAAYQPEGAASFAASLLDLSGNGNNATDPGGANTPAWDTVNGWKPVGGQYLITAFTPQNDQSQTILIKFSNYTAGNTWIAGVSSGANCVFAIAPAYAGAIRYYNGQLLAPSLAVVAATLGVAGSQGYRNGVADGGAIGAWAGASGFPLWLLALNNLGVLAGGCTAYIQRVAIYDTVLTAPQMAAVTAGMA